MTERLSKGLLIAEAVLLLVPLTLLTLFFVLVSYSAYPPPDFRPIQVAFDLAVVLTIAALVATWRLVSMRLRAGPGALRTARSVWFVLMAAGALIGLASLLVILERVLNPGAPGDYVGFALLAPAAVLGLLAIHLILEVRGNEEARTGRAP